MKNIKNLLWAFVVLATGAAVTSCSLDEENPSAYTLESLSTSLEGYDALINQCYFGIERKFYGGEYWMLFSEADSDLWTVAGNKTTSWKDYFWFYGGAPNTTYTADIWYAAYDGIAGCNLAIATKNNPPFATEEARNAKVAEAYFMRAVYYYNIVEQFGGVTKLLEPQSGADYAPMRTEPLDIYKEVIIPDLEFATQWLPVGTHATTTTPPRKAAMGMLAKAYLTTYYYGTTEYVDDALEVAKQLIADCEAGGGTYNTHMYADYADIFAEANNYENKEALWKHRWNPNGSSNGNYKMNFYDQKFLCNIYSFPGIKNTYQYRMTWEGDAAGQFMPTQHLLNLFVQEDGTLDPRFHTIFTTEWNATDNFAWTSDYATNFQKDASVVGKTVAAGELGIKFVMPQDADYTEAVANKKSSAELIVDYKDVYDDTNKKVIDNYADGTENLLHAFYPSLNKHNSSNYFVANAAKGRIGNLNATFIMRMAEIYLIAAEADIVANGGANAMGYINKVRARAGAKALSGTATIRTVLDERARELCGEGMRFYDLKRTGMFKDASYLQATHPDLAQFFKPEYALRPISTTFTDGLSNGKDPMWQNPGY